MQRLLTATALAAVIIATVTAFTGVLNASERRAEYLAQEAGFFECIESGLSRAECKAGIF